MCVCVCVCINMHALHDVYGTGVVYREDTDEVLMLQDKYNYKVDKN